LLISPLATAVKTPATSNERSPEPSGDQARASKIPMTQKRLVNFAAIDGRSGVAIRYRAVLRSLLADLFGTNKANAAEIALCETAATLITQLEIGRAEMLSGGEPNADSLVRLANAANRIMKSLRTKSAASKPTQSLAEYLAMTGNANAETDDEEEGRTAEHN
jgi:hypothetical protein